MITNQNARNGRTRFALFISFLLIGAAAGLATSLHLLQKREFSANSELFSVLVESKFYDMAGFCGSQNSDFHLIPSAPPKCEWLASIQSHPYTKRYDELVNHAAIAGSVGGAAAGMFFLFLISAAIGRKGARDE